MNKEEEKELVKYTSYGLIIGLMVGVLTKNIGLWLPMGVALGAAYHYQQRNSKNQKEG